MVFLKAIAPGITQSVIYEQRLSNFPERPFNRPGIGSEDLLRSVVIESSGRENSLE